MKAKLVQILLLGLFVAIAILIRPSTASTVGPPSINADTVDGFHASATPTANTLLALDANAKFSNTALYMGSGGGLDADLLDGLDASAFVRQGQANSVTSNMVTDGAITTAKLASNSVTQYAQMPARAPEFLLTGDGYKLIPGASVTLNSTGGPVMILMTGMVRPNATGATVIVSMGCQDTELGGGSAFTRYPFTLYCIYPVPAGEHTWSASAAVWAGDAYVYITAMTAIELKR